MTDQPTDLRDRIAAALYAHDHPGHLVPLNETGMGPAYRESADAMLAVLPEFADRAAIYAEVADRLAADAEQGAKEGFTRIYRRSAAKQVRDWADELRRMAVEAQQQTEAGCPDPIECGHEAALGQARETNRRLNLRAQHLESELAAFRRAVASWQVSERGTYITHASLQAIGKAGGVDLLGSVRHLKHFQRVEQAEAAIERVRALHVPDENGECRDCGASFDPCPTIATLNQPAVVAAVAGEEPDTETSKTDASVVCEGFQWIGQPFRSCDRCGQPAWEHAGEDVPVEGAGPFDNRRTVRPWGPGEADRIRAKWAPAVSQPGKEA